MSWFFKNKKLANLNEVKTDIHSHLIPGIDDGAENMEESVQLISQLKELGYRKLILTPHVRYGSFDNDTSTFDKRLEEVKEALWKEGIDIELEVGAEQTIDEGFEEHFKKGELKHFGKHKYLLIEFPFISIPTYIKDLVFNLQTSGYRLILAHPERYLYLPTEPGLIEHLHNAGVLFQLNILSLIGFYDRHAQKFAEKLIENDKIDLIGTDLHHQAHIDGLKEALTNKYLINLIESKRLMNNMF